MSTEALDIAAGEVEGRGVRNRLAVDGRAAGGVDGDHCSAGQRHVRGKADDLDTTGNLNRVLGTDHCGILDHHHREAGVRKLNADRPIRGTDKGVDIGRTDEDLRDLVRGHSGGRHREAEVAFERNEIRDVDRGVPLNCGRVAARQSFEIEGDIATRRMNAGRSANHGAGVEPRPHLHTEVGCLKREVGDAVESDLAAVGHEGHLLVADEQPELGIRDREVGIVGAEDGIDVRSTDDERRDRTDAGRLVNLEAEIAFQRSESVQRELHVTLNVGDVRGAGPEISEIEGERLRKLVAVGGPNRRTGIRQVAGEERDRGAATRILAHRVVRPFDSQCSGAADPGPDLDRIRIRGKELEADDRLGRPNRIERLVGVERNRLAAVGVADADGRALDGDAAGIEGQRHAAGRIRLERVIARSNRRECRASRGGGSHDHGRAIDAGLYQKDRAGLGHDGVRVGDRARSAGDSVRDANCRTRCRKVPREECDLGDLRGRVRTQRVIDAEPERRCGAAVRCGRDHDGGNIHVRVGQRDLRDAKHGVRVDRALRGGGKQDRSGHASGIRRKVEAALHAHHEIGRTQRQPCRPDEGRVRRVAAPLRLERELHRADGRLLDQHAHAGVVNR